MRPVQVGHILQIAPKCPPAWADALTQAMPLHNINTPERVAHFLAQCAHESAGFTVFEERLMYSAERLMAVWPDRFHSIAEAHPYARNPTALANHVYANRLGNGNEASGDGYRFRGRGCIQITGRTNYQAAGLAVERDLGRFPDDAAAPYVAALIAGWFWQTRGLNVLADANDVQQITRRINGGLNGLDDRQAYLGRARRVLAP